MAEETRLRILLADDHEMVRAGLKRLINDEADMLVIAEANDAREALRLARAVCPEVALVDVSMPGEWDGVMLAERLRDECPSIRVVALTRHDEAAFVAKMRRSGAVGYVLKQSAAAVLVDAIRKVAAGDIYIDPAVRGVTLPMPSAAASVPISTTEHPPLSSEEEQVVQLVARSYSTREIASQLALTDAQVRDCRASAMRKIGVSKRMDIVRYARARAWIE